jgi:hypothetical protein
VNLIDTILNSQGGQAVEKLAAQYGLTAAQIQEAAQKLVPALVNGVKNAVAQPGGAQKLLDTLKQGDYTQYLNNVSAAFSSSGLADGNRVIEQLFGAKEAAIQIASRAADAGTVQAEKVREMLPAMANLVMGALQKVQQSPVGEILNTAMSSPLGKIVGGFIGGAQEQGSNALGALGALLEKHKVSSIADEVISAANKALRR